MEDEYLNAIIAAGFRLKQDESLNLLEVRGKVSNEEIESLIVAEGESSRYAPYIAQRMRIWVHTRHTAGMANEQAQILTGRGFTTMYNQAVNAVCQDGLMEYATAALTGQAQIDGELASNQLYIAQMDWVKVPPKTQSRAARDYIISAINRQAWMDDSSIKKEDVEHFEDILRSSHRQKSRDAKIKCKGESDEEIGLATFDDCLSPEHCRSIKIGNKDALDGTVEGAYHALANDAEIGWHPDWKAKAKKHKEAHGDAG